ncbi:MAG: transcription elongation factor GreA [Nocardioidaceae bacterium]|nr:transcription elongation factor GreA [Nocardioidaceae bacterium]
MTQSSERETIWLTQDAYDKLAAELEQLRGPQRAEVVSRISAAREEGDLKENGGYHAAREELGKLDGRVAQLVSMLEKAEVGEAADDGTVSPGFEVTAKIEGQDEMSFLLGAREMASGDIDVFSPQSPLGSALIGAREGETVEYEAPNGKKIKVTVVKAAPYHG